MFRKVLKYLFFTLLWCAVGAYVVYSAYSTRRHRSEHKVHSMVIEVVDSSSMGHLVSQEMVRKWIDNSQIKTVGEAIGSIDLLGLERMIARNGFVSNVTANVTYSGALNIKVSQRRPLFRLLVNGYNSYVTEEGYIFVAPLSSALYVPVITGSYSPMFPASYNGQAKEFLDGEIVKSELRIADIEKEKYPFYRMERDNDQNIRALRGMTISKGWFESDDAFWQRVDNLKKHKASLRRSYRYKAQLIQSDIDRISEKQQAERRSQKKSEKSYEDFCKLIIFVKWIENDNFWRSEIVQIDAQTTENGVLEVVLTPRSGRHTIIFGGLDHFEDKFAKLYSFYNHGLRNLGWEEYRTINVKYREQIICTK